MSPAQEYLLELPDVSPAEYLITLWGEAGTVTQNGMGISGLTWTELSNWIQQTELDLTVWEKLSIKAISDAYAAEYSAASAKDRPAPYQPIFTPDFDRAAVAVQVRSVMQSIMAQQAQIPKKPSKKQ